MGPQGCGKGTIAELLGAKLNLPIVSVGALLRAVPESSPYHDVLQTSMNSGELAPNDIVAKIIEGELSRPEFSNGYILDGWLRQISDVNLFDPNPNLVFVLNISRETSLKRISGRRLCTLDGETYNIYTLPKEELAKCHGALIQREDDTIEAVNKRLDIYYTKTQEVIDYYKKKGVLIEIDGEGSPNEVFELILLSLKIK